MIEEDYVSFEVAKGLKEKGFNEYCEKSYSLDGKLYSNFPDDCILAPTLQMAAKWLRVVHKIDLCVFPCYYDYCLYGYDCKIYKNKELLCSLARFKTYEEAMNEALLLVLDRNSKIIQ